MRPSSSPVPTPKWMRGTPRSASAGEAPWWWRAGRSGGSRRARARRPSCRRAAPRPRPRADLGPQRGQGQVGQPVEQGGPGPGVAVHQRLGLGVVPRRPALDQVAGHGEGRPGEADQGDVELLDGQLRRSPGPTGCPRSGSSGRSRSRSAALRKGCSTTGPRPGCDVDAEADGGHRHHDVGVQDGGVHAVAAHRLQGDLGRQLGLAQGVEDAAGRPAGPGTRAGTARPGA